MREMTALSQAVTVSKDSRRRSLGRLITVGQPEAHWGGAIGADASAIGDLSGGQPIVRTLATDPPKNPIVLATVWFPSPF